MVGLVHGSDQALSRALFARLTPEHEAGRFFGLYNMMRKFAAASGTALVGITAAATGNPRAGILSMLALFLAGGRLLWCVDAARGAAARPTHATITRWTSQHAGQLPGCRKIGNRFRLLSLF